MKFKLIPILVLSLLLIPCVANGKEYTPELDKPLYFYDFENWKKHPDSKFNEWDDMKSKWFSSEAEGHKWIEINTNGYTFITNITDLCSTTQYVFSVKDLENVSLDNPRHKKEKKDLDLVIQGSSLNLCTTNLLCSYEHRITKTNITQLYYDVIISNITFNVLSEKKIKNSSQDPDYAFNIANDIKLVKLLKDEDFNTLTKLYPEENFRRAKDPFTFTNPSTYHITNGLSVYVNGEVVGKVTNNNQIAWNDTLLEKDDEYKYIEIKEISFLPFSSVKAAWDRNRDKGYVRQSISNFVANASNINSNFYNSVTNYFETILPKVSITNECGQAVRVQIGDPKKPLTLFDLENDTPTNICDQTLLNALFDNKPINYWVINSCTNCPVTTNKVKQTFDKYNGSNYVINLKLNKPSQKDVSRVSITKIPGNAEVEFNGNKLSPTGGIITISTTPHTTNGTFNVTQLYYKSTNIIFTSGCINSTNYIAYPKLTPLNWQSCSITNTSQYPCNIKISYSNIINDVAIAIIDEVPIGTNSMTKYELKSDLIDPVTVIFSWNKNAITNTFTRVEDSENNSINIEVQGMDPVSAFVDKTNKAAINLFCRNVDIASRPNNDSNKESVEEAFQKGIFKDYTNFVDVTNIITQAKNPSGGSAFDKLLENGSIKTNYFGVIHKAFFEAHPEQNKEENKYEK